MAVLIDVDHASNLGFPINVKSVMYSKEFNSLHKYEWRQFAIMLARILANYMDNYHVEEPSFPTDDFGNTLRSAYNNGESPDISKFQLTGNELSLNDILATRQLENVLNLN